MEIINWLFGRGGWWIAKLKHDSFARLYRDLLTSLLDRIDRAISPAPEWPDAKGLPKTEPGRAWSWRLWHLAMLGHEPVLRFTLSVCEGFARSIGAV